MKEVELIPAYEWSCGDCGVTNFTRPIPTLITDLPEQVRESMFDPTQPFEDGERVLSQPETVTCKECKSVFTAYMHYQQTLDISPGDDEDET
jgi:hypothetical protein